jgi:thiol-disulfide isomerase/thioredoxin
VTKPRLLVLAILAGAAVLLLIVLYGKMGPIGKASGPLPEPPASLAPFKKAQTVLPVPAVAFSGAGGALKSLSEYKGRVVLLNLWAPWCGPCVKELPALAALQKALPSDRFVVLPIDAGREGQAEAQAFLAAHGAGNLQTFVDSNAAVMRTFGAVGLPMTILIDKDGKEIGRAEGAPDWSAPGSVAYLRGVVER